MVSLVWSWSLLLPGWRRRRARPEDVSRLVFRQQTRGMGLRMTEWLRDRLRPSWLRLHRSEVRND